MESHFDGKLVSKAWLIVNSVCRDIQPICEEGFESLSDQLCYSVEFGVPFVVWGLHGERMTIGAGILNNCILVER